MSFFRSFLILSFLSLFLALVFLLFGYIMGHVEYRGGYAVLETDASIEDAKLLELINSGKNSFSGDPVCESSQWVLLDEFGSLEMIPLNQYEARLFPFDPRNDGYAQKMKNVFVRDGKRFIYFPLKTGNVSITSLDKQFNNLLKDISFSADYFIIGKPLAFFFITYAAASLLLIIICYVKKNTNHTVSNIIMLLPLLSSLVFFGTNGIVAAALLLGFFVMFKEPLYEIISGSARKIKSLYKDIFEPYRHYWFFLVLFAVIMTITVIYSQLKVLFLSAVFVAAGVIFIFSIKTFSLLGGHKRFNPVMIIRKRTVNFSFSLCMLPFFAASLFLMLFSPYLPGVFLSDTKFEHIIDERDYYSHLAFQSSFSTRQLGNTDPVYSAYFYGEDGLPMPDTTNNSIPVAYNIDDFPLFPLKNLMDFFNGINSENTVVSGVTGDGIADKLPLFLLLIFIIFCFFLQGKYNFAEKIPFTELKRFSSKLRWSNINRKKVLLYNDKIDLRFRKDA